MLFRTFRVEKPLENEIFNCIIHETEWITYTLYMVFVVTIKWNRVVCVIRRFVCPSKCRVYHNCLLQVLWKSVKCEHSVRLTALYMQRQITMWKLSARFFVYCSLYTKRHSTYHLESVLYIVPIQVETGWNVQLKVNDLIAFSHFRSLLVHVFRCCWM